MKEIAEIRKGEELDTNALAGFIESSMPVKISDLRIMQFPSGSSNLTYCVSFGGEEYVLRRPPFGNRVKSAHDMSREFSVLTALSEVYAQAPATVLYCADKSVIGSEFYLMERKHGTIVRGDWPFDDSSPAMLSNATRAFAENLAELHAVDYEAAGLGSFGNPNGYAKRQVEGWTKRYFEAKTDEWSELERAINWLNDRIPEDDGAALVHNDYKFDNIILAPSDPTRIVAVLDWEMATIGSPLMDLGTTLGYWMSKDTGEELLSMPFNPRVLMENVKREELVAMYADASARDVSNINYYYIFGTFKIAVIAQQIYYRYARGFTADERFSEFNKLVGTLGRIAGKAIEG